MMKSFKKFWKYILGKKTELADLEKKDLHLAKIVLDIHRTKSGSRFIMVPLFSLKQIHAIDRDNAVLATEKRVNELLKVKENLLAEKNITRMVLAEYLPSISWIKVVKESDGDYIAYEGNGRLVAMQQVFCPEDGIMVEVEEYFFRKPKKIVSRMNRIRKLNKLK